MAYYSLLIVDKQETFGTVALDRAEAIAMFGRQLGREFTLAESDAGAAQYLLDEWWEHPHWVDHTIPVFTK